MADIIQIVKYEGDNSTFIWKSPVEDFNTGTQLIVHESQEAIFFTNGQALDLFGPGRHTLETQNIPLVKKFFNKPTNNETPFHCEVYFINKTEQMSIKWGTDSQVQYMEPTYKFPLKIGASGEMSLRVEDSRKLLVKVVGTSLGPIDTDNGKNSSNSRGFKQSDVIQIFRSFLMAKVKPYLAQTMQGSDFGIFEVDSRMGELSGILHKQLMPDFTDYGISLERFFVTTIVKPDGDKAYERFKEIHVRQYADVAEAQLRQKVGIIDQQTSAQKMVIESQGIAQKRVQEGYTYQDERGFDVAEKVAQNEGAGNFSSTGIGLGMMGGVAGGMGGMIAGMTTNAMGQIGQQQPGVQAPNVFMGVPMPSVGVPQPPLVVEPVAPSASVPNMIPDDMTLFKQKLEKLKMMKETGILSDEEFELQKKSLLSSL
ncbi:MAG: SPFH domain-containing protein [Chitinispirillia bacterium]|nr:SPFH domain-containing protein [Chitinispirillia bacterium]